MIGSPTKRMLWGEWRKLYPATFTAELQKKFFENKGLIGVTLQDGNRTKSQKEQAEKHKL